MKKRALCWLLVVVMAVSLLPFSALAEDAVAANGATIINPDTSFTVRRDLVLDKTLTANEDGTFDLQLETYATGEVTTKVVTSQVPTDFVLVVDQSGSMDTQDMPTDYKVADMPSGGWKISDLASESTDADGNNVDKEYYYYDQNTGDYYRVYRKWGDLFQYVPRNSLYCVDLVDENNLGWFASNKETAQDIASTYYYQPSSDQNVDLSTSQYSCGKPIQSGGASDNNFYPITITSQGKTLYYSIRFKYTDSNGNAHWLRWINNATNSTANKNKETGNCIWYRNPSGGYFGPGDSYVVRYSTANSTVTGWISGNSDYDSFYTYGEVVGLNTGMYIQNPLFIRHVGYNAIAYRDSNGVEHYLVNTDYCNSAGTPTSDKNGATTATYSGNLYQATGTKQTRLAAVQNAINTFVETVANQTDDNGVVDHRVAIVGFSSDGYNNNELLTNTYNNFSVNHNASWTNESGSAAYSLDGKAHDGVQKSTADSTTAYYANALVTAHSDSADNGVNPALPDGIKGLTAHGGTQPGAGLDMAYQILKLNDKNGEYAAGTRNAVVIFFTDGRPGNYSYVNQYAEANTVVGSAKSIKTDISGVQIYSVGVFGEADGNPLTYPYVYNKRYVGFVSTSDDYQTTYAEYYTAVRDKYNPRFVKQEVESSGRIKISYTHVGTLWDSTRDETVNYYNLSTYFRECLRNTLGYPSQQNDTIADYMTVVSSTYPNAKTFDGNWYSYTGSSTYNTIVNNARGSAVSKNYYMLCTDTSRLNEVFVNIANDVSTAGTSVTLNDKAVLKDIVNTDVFAVPASANVSAYTVEASAVEVNGNVTYSFGSTAKETLSPVVGTDGSVSVTGFDYSSHYVMPDPPSGVTGRKLILEIKGLTPKAEIADGTRSNLSAGIYAEDDGTISTTPTLSIDSPQLTVSGAVNPTYIINYNAKMKVASDAERLVALGTSANGSFDRNATTKDVTYQLISTKADPTTEGTKTVVAYTFNEAAYSGMDQAMVYGVPVNAGTSAKAWNKITAIPASNIYFDDDLANVTLDADTSDGAKATMPAPSASVNSGKTEYTFTFYGTAIDIYCTTDSASGSVQAALFNDAGERVGNPVLMRNYSTKTRYNVPTLHFEQESAGQYTVKVTAGANAKYQLDGVRIYNAAGANQAIYQDTDEQYAAYLNLRDALINNGADTTATVSIDTLADDAFKALFIDDASSLTKTTFDKDGNETKLYKTTFEGYSANSPKNEIYLDKGQAVTFKLSSTVKDATNAKLWLGLSAPNEGTTFGDAVKVSVNGTPVKVTSAAEMYYPIDMPTTDVIKIENTGNAMISVTNLKITGVKAIADVQTDAARARGLAFDPLTMQTVILAANNGVDPDAEPDEPETPNVLETPDDPDGPSVPDTPDTPEEPDDPKPGWSDGVTLVKTVFQQLVKNLLGLFSGLGKW